MNFALVIFLISLFSAVLITGIIYIVKFKDNITALIEENKSIKNPIKTKAPFVDTQAPFIDTQAPFIDTQSPFVDTQSPFIDTEAPFIDTQAPFIDTQAPFVDTQAPFPPFVQEFQTQQPTFDNEFIPIVEIVDLDSEPDSGEFIEEVPA